MEEYPISEERAAPRIPRLGRSIARLTPVVRQPTIPAFRGPRVSPSPKIDSDKIYVTPRNELANTSTYADDTDPPYDDPKIT
jgi:hypothetical protein